MDANGAVNSPLPRQMQLRSQGPVDLLDTTQLNPPGSYVRSCDYQQRCNVNAGYNTVGLKIRERRRKLVAFNVTILGGDQRYWFAPRLRPEGLPLSPLDWSTTLLEYLGTFANSIPSDPHTTTIEQRLEVAHQNMLAKAATVSEVNHSATLANKRRPEELFRVGSEHDQVHQLRAKNMVLLDEITALDDEIFGLNLSKAFDESTISDLKEELHNTATGILECKRELEALRERNAWSERDLAIMSRVQTFITERWSKH